MVKWEVDLTEFEPVNFGNINQIINPNYDDLDREITAFNNEINWDSMWTIYDAKDRLAAGWLFVGLFVNYKIKGWVWLNTSTNLLCNLYVNKEHRNFYNAKNLVLKLHSVAKEFNIEKIYAESDTWNNRSKLIALKTGYRQQD